MARQPIMKGGRNGARKTPSRRLTENKQVLLQRDGLSESLA